MKEVQVNSGTAKCQQKTTACWNKIILKGQEGEDTEQPQSKGWDISAPLKWKVVQSPGTVRVNRESLRTEHNPALHHPQPTGSTANMQSYPTKLRGEKSLEFTQEGKNRSETCKSSS